MELILTKSQQQYLDKKGAVSSSALKEAYKKSVQEQRRLIESAKKMRAASSSK